MKVARDVKGDVGKSGGNSSSGDSGALFPRLHVKETKADGPRAPPRNKMALYEQFSIPSQRFAAASGNGAGNKKALYEQFSIPSHRFFQPGRQNPAMMNQPAIVLHGHLLEAATVFSNSTEGYFFFRCNKFLLQLHHSSMLE